MLCIGPGDSCLSRNPMHWIDDGLVAVFFLVVGLETRRTTLAGEPSSVRGAALPIVAAVPERCLSEDYTSV